MVGAAGGLGVGAREGVQRRDVKQTCVTRTGRRAPDEGAEHAEAGGAAQCGWCEAQREEEVSDPAGGLRGLGQEGGVHSKCDKTGSRVTGLDLSF